MGSYLNSNGKIKSVGEYVIDEQLAATLERIANDNTKDTFYTGSLAEDIAADLKGNPNFDTEKF